MPGIAALSFKVLAALQSLQDILSSIIQVISGNYLNNARLRPGFYRIQFEASLHSDRDSLVTVSVWDLHPVVHPCHGGFMERKSEVYKSELEVCPG